MLDYKNIIIKRYALHLSGRKIARQIGASKSEVNEFLIAFEECDAISYPLPVGITNYGIAKLVYGNLPDNNGRNPGIMYPDYEDVHKQLSSRKNMTLIFLWNRYKSGARRKVCITINTASSASITPNGTMKMPKPCTSTPSSVKR